MVMVGILPTLLTEQITAATLSANPRYALLNEQIFAARGEDLQISITGVERLRRDRGHDRPRGGLHQRPVPPAGQPGRFAGYWNAAQAVAGVQVALGANSPFLFGKELWRETRIPLFEQATDTRPAELKAQGVRPEGVVRRTLDHLVFDLFEENVRYFPALLPVCPGGPGAGAGQRYRAASGGATPAQRDDLPLEPADLPLYLRARLRSITPVQTSG